MTDEAFFLLILGVSLSGGFSLALLYGICTEKQRERSKLRTAFYRLLEKGSNITVLGLAVRADVEVNSAKRYLKQQSKELGADFDVDSDGELFYRFHKIYPQLPPS